MKDENKTRVELLKELEILEQRINELQKSNKQWERSNEKLKKDHLHLEQLAEKHVVVLRESKDLLDKIINLNPDWIFAKDKDYHYILVNEGYASALGKSKEELIGKNDIEVGFPEELIFGNLDKGITGFRSDDKRVLEGETIHNEYDPAAAADGALHIFDTYKIPLRDNRGNVYAILGYARDITRRKRAEEEIQSITTKWQTTFNAMNDAVSLIDNNGIVLQCNQSYLNLFGKTETEVLGKHCWEIVHGTDEAINKCSYAKMKKSFQRESVLLPMDDRWFNVVIDPIFDADYNL
ncbi:MAG: PAS domain-containing protein, partial [Atribacterota bacterium]|nr:PAS domain-containing protein [Atribacterota bacterium]